jgi:hypothetical protein
MLKIFGMSQNLQGSDHLEHVGTNCKRILTSASNSVRECGLDSSSSG